MHISTPVRHGHGSSDAGVPLLDEVDWCLVHVLDLALQHGVPDEAGARAHDLGDAARAQHVGGHHAGQVTHHAAAHRPRHLAQADVALNTILSVSLPVLYLSLYLSSDRASFGYLGDTPDRNFLAAESPLSEPKVPCLVCFISRQRAESGRELDKLENYSTINLDIENSPSMLQYYNSLYTETEGGRDGEVDTQIVLLWRQFFLERKLNSVTVNLIHPLQTLEVRKI